MMTRKIREHISWKCASWLEMKSSFYMIEKAPFQLCMTPEALQTMLSSVGSKPPETGAKGFGPVEFLGIDTIEPEPSSHTGFGAVYAPDTEWGDKTLEYHRLRNKLWTTDIHSHPGNLGTPSWKSGKGLGDLGYVEEVFKQNETMLFFFIPILTGTLTAEVTIWPWVCKRGEKDEPILMFADLCICPPSCFPVRPFNPKWEQQVEDAKNTAEKNKRTPPKPSQPTPLPTRREERKHYYGDFDSYFL